MAPNFDPDIDNDIDALLDETIKPFQRDHKNALTKLTKEEISEFLHIILQRYATLTIYVIEPHIPLTNGEPIKIAAGERYSINDYGGRLVIAANDPMLSDLLVAGPFLAAIAQALQLLQDVGAQEIAILGDIRGKQFLWTQCEIKKALQGVALAVVNFNPAQQFTDRFEFIRRYLKEHGMEPTLAPKIEN